MNIARKLRLIVAATLVAGFSHQAFAVPVVIQDHPRVAVGILKLDVLGTLYDVTFNNFASGTFVGDTAAATAARDAINAALNSSTADLVRILSTGVTVNNFGVQDAPGSSVRGVSFFIASNWQAAGSTVLAAPIAQFALHVPEPTTALLVGLGLAGLAASKRRARPA